jgi:hypothetical protein
MNSVKFNFINSESSNCLYVGGTLGYGGDITYKNIIFTFLLHIV